MRRVAITLATALIVAGATTPAAAQLATPPDPTRTRLSLGIGLGGLVGANDAGTPQGSDQRGFANEFGLFARYERRLGDQFAMAATASSLAWYQSAANDAGYRLQRFDLGVAPTFRAMRSDHFGDLIIELYVALPVGVSIPNITPPARRAVSERIDNHIGWFAGGTIGCAALIGPWGLFVEVGYQRAATGIRSVVTPTDGTPASDRRIDYVDHQLIISTGGFWSF